MRFLDEIEKPQINVALTKLIYLLYYVYGKQNYNEISSIGPTSYTSPTVTVISADS